MFISVSFEYNLEKKINNFLQTINSEGDLSTDAAVWRFFESIKDGQQKADSASL